MEPNEPINEMQKIRNLIMTLSATVYAQSCFIQILGQKTTDPVSSELLVMGSGMHRRSLMAAMRDLGIDCKELEELDNVMAQFEEYQKTISGATE
jgi:hypothetical protein